MDDGAQAAALGGLTGGSATIGDFLLSSLSMKPTDYYHSVQLVQRQQQQQRQQPVYMNHQLAGEITIPNETLTPQQPAMEQIQATKSTFKQLIDALFFYQEDIDRINNNNNNNSNNYLMNNSLNNQTTERLATTIISEISTKNIITTTTTTTFNDEQQQLQINWFNFLMASLIILLILSTAVGNLFVIVAILIERNLRTIGNYLVLSLAIADLLVACLVMPLAGIYLILKKWTLGALLCDIWTSADVFCCTGEFLFAEFASISSNEIANNHNHSLHFALAGHCPGSLLGRHSGGLH